ncbi:MAG: hypothetical protein ABIO16_11555, partial [Nocardioides sp.]
LLRLGRALRTPTGIVVLAVGLAVMLRLPFLHSLAFPDEAGLLLVARNRHEGGTNLYGTLFVDRPPLLVIFWQVANHLGGIEAARVMGLVAVAVVVAAAGWIGHTLAGRRGTTWAALVAAVLVANPMIGTTEINAELLGAPLTLVSIGCLLAATRPPVGPPLRWRRTSLVVAAGTAGAGAMLVKQNLMDALVFGAALALTAALAGRWPWARARRVLGLGLAGALLPVALTALWAVTDGPGLVRLWDTLYAFRFDASHAIGSVPSPANDARRLSIGWLAVVSGIAVVVAVGGATLWRPLRGRDPLSVATGALVAWEVVGILGGGSYWSHYLVGLVPGVVMVVAVTATRGRWSRRLGACALAFTVTSALLATGLQAGTARTREARPDRVDVVGTWVSDAARPGDTGTVLYGNADLLLIAHLTPGTDQLWSLPTRTLDPRLVGLNRQLNGPTPPTWVLQPMPLDTWGLDPDHLVLATLTLRYRVVATVCGIPIYLHRGQHRILPGLATPCP